MISSETPVPSAMLIGAVDTMVAAIIQERRRLTGRRAGPVNHVWHSRLSSGRWGGLAR
jgi:hypothetical protein